jgi:hypothetical protein
LGSNVSRNFSRWNGFIGIQLEWKKETKNKNGDVADIVGR